MTKHTGRTHDRSRVTHVTPPTKTNKLAPMASRRPLALTGVPCQACRQPVAVLDHIAERSLTLLCPACGHQWSAAAQGAQQL